MHECIIQGEKQFSSPKINYKFERNSKIVKKEVEEMKYQ